MITSKKIQIEIQTQYLQAQASANKKYPFAYKVNITNNTDQAIQLVNRYWLITDGDGKKTEVRGAGVVGEQPWLQVGESFEYTSGAVLETPVGSMEGFYEMQGEDGVWLQAPIELFSLAVPNVIN